MKEGAEPYTSSPWYSDAERDLGFGTVIASETRKRLLNRDGSFNVRRRGLPFWRSLSLYHWLLNVTWTRFLLLVVAGYIALNALFGTVYFLLGPGALAGTTATGLRGWLDSFFFSVQTLATIGYGRINPSSMAANLVAAAEAIAGLLSIALVTGMLFARFSQPLPRIVFSRHALIAPYRDGTAFMFRIANERSSEMVEVEAKVVLALFDTVDGHATRRFHVLTLERNRVAFLPLSWTVVHAIDEASPLYRLTRHDLADRGAEFLILLTAIDETFSQTVHTRSSYRYEEVVWGARFVDIFQRDEEALGLTVDISRIHDYEVLPVAAGTNR